MRLGSAELKMRSRIEVLPHTTAKRQLQAVPRNTVVTVTCSPKQGVDHTLDFADDLVAERFTVVPHIAARMIESSQHLEQIVKRITTVGYTQLFVVSGDHWPPAGPFADSGQLLNELAPRVPEARIGVAGYPEGHPAVSDRALVETLLAKQRNASLIVTQMCFDADAIITWVRAIRHSGITLPVLVGVPGPVARTRLLELATRVGVGASLRYIRKNAATLATIMRRASYHPDPLVTRLAAHIAEHPSLGIKGLHLYTFNEVATTDSWRRVSD